MYAVKECTSYEKTIVDARSVSVLLLVHTTPLLAIICPTLIATLRIPHQKTSKVLVRLEYRRPLTLLNRLRDNLASPYPIDPASGEIWLIVVKAMALRLSTLDCTLVDVLHPSKVLLG